MDDRHIDAGLLEGVAILAILFSPQSMFSKIDIDIGYFAK
jgi:hypothetical protein